MAPSVCSCLLLFLIQLCVAVDANGIKDNKGLIGLPKDHVAAVQQLREEGPCKNCTICTIQGGYCISKKTGHCNGKKLRSLCWSRFCTCCIETSMDGRMNNLVSNMTSVREEVDSKPSWEEMESQNNSTSVALSTIMDKLSVIQSIDDKVHNLESDMISVREDIKEIESDSNSTSTAPLGFEIRVNDLESGMISVREEVKEMESQTNSTSVALQSFDDKVNNLESDMISVREEVEEMESRTNSTLVALQSIDDRFNNLESDMISVREEVEEMESRTNSSSVAFQRFDDRVNNLESNMISVREEVKEMESRTNSTSIAFQSIDDRVNNLESDMISVRDVVEMASQINSSSVELSTILDKLPIIQTQLYCILNKYSFYNGSCYFFSSTTATWQNARDICGQKGGDLVIINNDEKFNFLREYVTGEPWVGAYEEGTEGQFLWVDGSSLPLESPWWHDTQPDNWMIPEDCVHFWALKKFADGGCNTVRTYICEITPDF